MCPVFNFAFRMVVTIRFREGLVVFSATNRILCIASSKITTLSGKKLHSKKNAPRQKNKPVAD